MDKFSRKYNFEYLLLWCLLRQTESTIYELYVFSLLSTVQSFFNVDIIWLCNSLCLWSSTIAIPH